MKGFTRLKWLLTMAWRDSRRNQGRLFLFITSTILAIATLVAIYSLRYNLEKEVDAQASTLLGADLEIIDNKPFEDDITAFADSIGAAKSEEWSFGSMVYFPKGQGSRLAQIRALSGDFPYYGQLNTIPAEAAHNFRSQKAVLVEQSLLLQFGAVVGDSLKVGEVTFLIAGALQQAPGQSGIVATVAPVVYLPLSYLASTGLDDKGSRINYRYFLKLDEPQKASSIAEAYKYRYKSEDTPSIRTIEDQKESTGRFFSNLTNFLGLAGFIALILGCIGVASSVYVYIQDKVRSVAILRCLGTPTADIFLIFIIQIFIIGFIGSTIGAALGSFLQVILPKILADLLPFQVKTSLSVFAILQGLALGTISTLLFSLLSLLPLRNVSALQVFQNATKPPKTSLDIFQFGTIALLLTSIYLFGYIQLDSWKAAGTFIGGLCIAFGLLYLVAKGIIVLVKRFFPKSSNYLIRQGLSNLFRPNNQTMLLIVSVGLGTMLITTLVQSRKLLVDELQIATSKDNPNMVIFDVQEGQLQALQQMVLADSLPLIESVPIVNMRLNRASSIEATKNPNDSTSERSRIYKREYRVTYRSDLSKSESISSGTFTGTYTAGQGLVPVSIEEGFAKRNKLSIGDTLDFNIHSLPLRTVIGSIRKVNWRGIQTNFVVVFPKGVLEQAPKFHVLLTHVPSLEKSAQIQQKVVQQHPNVSIVDLGLAFTTLETLTQKVGLVIRFMAAISILTGLIVLITSVMISKYQRVRESVLMRTIGATKRQLLAITFWEYAFLGIFASLTGVLLGLVATFALSHYSFETVFIPDFLSVSVIVTGITSITLIIGLLNSSSILNTSPLEVLRREG